MRGDICELYLEESRVRTRREGRGSVRQESDETSEESGGGVGDDRVERVWVTHKRD